MSTLREWFGGFVRHTGELPDSVVLSWGDWGVREEWPELPVGVVRFEALSPDVLGQGFDAGFGGNESPNLCAWSHSWVIFSDNYDGSEHLRWVPRSPTPHEPIRPGGG